MQRPKEFHWVLHQNLTIAVVQDHYQRHQLKCYINVYFNDYYEGPAGHDPGKFMQEETWWYRVDLPKQTIYLYCKNPYIGRSSWAAEVQRELIHKRIRLAVRRSLNVV